MADAIISLEDIQSILRDLDDLRAHPPPDIALGKNDAAHFAVAWLC